MTDTTAAALPIVREVTVGKNVKTTYRLTGTLNGRRPSVQIRRQERDIFTNAERWQYVTATPKSIAADVDAMKAEVAALVPAAEPKSLVPNAGTCAACCRPMKLDARGLLVLHGYERPGYGHVEGQCMGVGHRPHEVSAELAEKVLRMVEGTLERDRQWLARLENDQVDSFVVIVKTGDAWNPKPRGVDVKRGDVARMEHGRRVEGFDQVRKVRIAQAQGDVRAGERAVEMRRAMVDGWAERPLLVK